MDVVCFVVLLFCLFGCVWCCCLWLIWDVVFVRLGLYFGFSFISGLDGLVVKFGGIVYLFYFCFCRFVIGCCVCLLVVLFWFWVLYWWYFGILVVSCVCVFCFLLVCCLWIVAFRGWVFIVVLFYMLS